MPIKIGAEAGGGGDAAAEMARKLQDPLGNITALMTDNDISFKTGSGDDVSYGFQLQPVKAFSFETFNFIARAVVPVLGAANESQRTLFGDPIPDSGGGHTWGLSDIQTQFFFSPKTDSTWKWGVGPVISWKTRTDSAKDRVRRVGMSPMMRSSSVCRCLSANASTRASLLGKYW